MLQSLISRVVIEHDTFLLLREIIELRIVMSGSNPISTGLRSKRPVVAARESVRASLRMKDAQRRVADARERLGLVWGTGKRFSGMSQRRCLQVVSEFVSDELALQPTHPVAF